MPKQNCWEYRNCGRQPGGANTHELGVCTAATEKRLNGANNGQNGGRSCWIVTCTLCGGIRQSTFAEKIKYCSLCEFYKTVKREESDNLQSDNELIEKLK